MRLLNISTATVIGAGIALGAGVAMDTAPAQADPPGTYWCWAHLVPVAQQCPAEPPWLNRWATCSEGLFVLDDNFVACSSANYDPNQTYTFNCWGRDMILGQICPPLPPGPDAWLPCPNMPGHVYTLSGSCHKP